MSELDLENLSDEEFMKQAPPAMDKPAEQTNTPAESETQVTEEKPQEEESETEETQVEKTAEELAEEAAQVDKDKAAPEEKPGEPAKDAAEKPGEPAKEGDKPTEPTEPPNFEEMYTKIMAPFKANGKMIEVRTPEEAQQLMQMGANYTRKMQELAPHRKALLMLEKNGLLDEGKLSFLIDIEKKNPAAIQKLIKDSGIDPLEIDTTKEPAYREGMNRIADDEAKFEAALSDLKGLTGGKETLQTIDKEWDDVSKNHIWTDPDVLAIVHQHRESGIYDRITTELNRQKVLGKISADTPFISAYKQVGEQLTAAGSLNDLLPNKSPAPKAKTVVATRPAAVKPAVVNNDKAAAAASNRTTPAKAREAVNPLAMSDDDFMKANNLMGRV